MSSAASEAGNNQFNSPFNLAYLVVDVQGLVMEPRQPFQPRAICAAEPWLETCS
jgi:hypothetical protein